MANIFYNPDSRLSPVHFFCIRVAVAMTLLIFRPPALLFRTRPSDLETAGQFIATIMAILGAAALITNKWRRAAAASAIAAAVAALVWSELDVLQQAGQSQMMWAIEATELCRDAVFIAGLTFLVIPPKSGAMPWTANAGTWKAAWKPILWFFLALTLSQWLNHWPMFHSLPEWWTEVPTRYTPDFVAILAVPFVYMLLLFRISRPAGLLAVICMTPVPLVWAMYHGRYPAFSWILVRTHFMVLMALTLDPAWFPARPAGDTGKNLVLHDGLCGLCNRFVRLLWVEDLSSVLHFSPLQGETAKTVLERHPELEDVDSVVYVRDFGLPEEEMYTRSDAIMFILRDIGGFWRPVSWLWLLPQWLRDGVYDFVAHRRTRWFKQSDTCPAPEPELAERFLP